VDQTQVDHLEMETTTEEKLNARFKAFKQETARMGRAYWASVRRAEQRSKEIRQSYTPVHECPVCGLFRPAEHTQQCRDLRPVDLSMSEKIHWRDHGTDWNWDYEKTPE
jgi:hypothetical protein